MLNIVEPGKYLMNSLHGDSTMLMINCDLNELATDGYTVILDDGYGKHMPVKVYNSGPSVGTGTFTVELQFMPIRKVSIIGQHLPAAGGDILLVQPKAPLCQNDGNHNFSNFSDAMVPVANGRCINCVLVDPDTDAATALVAGDRVQVLLVFTV